MTVYEYDLKEILPRLQGPLRTILDREIAAGNSITEVAAAWPIPKCNVWLAHRFRANYALEYPNLRYCYRGDPKNWIEEYTDSERGLMVAVSA